MVDQKSIGFLKFSRDNFSEKEILQIAQALDCSFEGTFTMHDTNETI